VPRLQPAASRNGKDAVRPLDERAEDLFFQAHSHIRDIDGLHADEALDELCKVLAAKLRDEDCARRGGGMLRMRRDRHGSVEACAAAVRELARDTPLRLSSPALVRVVETLQGYTLTDSSADLKGRAFQRVIAPAIRAGMGQYFTPEPVVSFLTRLARPAVSDRILDPFCGSARFLVACLERVRRQTPAPPARALRTFSRARLHGIEKSERMVRIARTDMRLAGDWHAEIRCTDALLPFADYPDLRPGSFDLVLTNPPFGCLLGPEAVARLGTFTLVNGQKQVPLEVLGLERCVQLLKPGGRLGIVVPDGLLANRRARHVRAWLQRETKLRAVVSLPVETFAPFGANIKTGILLVRKWHEGELRPGDYPVFLGRVDNVGYDAPGRVRPGADLDAAAAAWEEFLEREGW
jgi:type I restriction enzyme M protein